MNLKLIFLLCTLPMLFFVPYYYGPHITGETNAGGFQVIKNYLNKNEPMKEAGLQLPEENSKTPLEQLFEKKVEKSQYTKAFKKHSYKTHSYYLQQPQKPWPNNIKFPLIVHLHDVNNIALTATITTTPIMALSHPAFNVAPSLPHRKIFASLSDKNKDKAAPEFVSTLVKKILQEYPIDQNRIYLVGCGYGAVGVFNEIEKNPNFYAGAIAINGAWNNVSKNLTQTPLLVMHGGANKVFHPLSTRNFVKKAKAAGATIGYKEFQSMEHTCSYKGLYSKKVWSWLFKQQR